MAFITFGFYVINVIVGLKSSFKSFGILIQNINYGQERCTKSAE